MEEKKFISHRKNKMLKRYAMSFPFFKRASAIFNIIIIFTLIVSAFLIVLIFFTFNDFENRFFLTLAILTFCGIISVVAFGIRQRPYCEIRREFFDRYDEQIVISEKGLQYIFVDDNLYVSPFVPRGITTVYSINYCDIENAYFDGFVLHLKGKATIDLYSDYPKKKKYTECNTKIFDADEVYRIFVAFDDNDSFLNELNKYIHVIKKDDEKIYFGNNALQKKRDLQNAKKHVPYRIISTATLIAEIFSILLFVLPFAAAYYFSDYESFIFGYYLSVVIFPTALVIKRVAFKRYAPHGYEEKHCLRINKDVIELVYTSKKDIEIGNTLVYKIKKDKIHSIYVDGNEIVIKGEGELRCYISYLSRCLSPADKDCIYELAHYNGHEYRILLAYKERKEIIQLIENMKKSHTD